MKLSYTIAGSLAFIFGLLILAPVSRAQDGIFYYTEFDVIDSALWLVDGNGFSMTKAIRGTDGGRALEVIAREARIYLDPQEYEGSYAIEMTFRATGGRVSIIGRGDRDDLCRGYEVSLPMNDRLLTLNVPARGCDGARPASARAVPPIAADTWITARLVMDGGQVCVHLNDELVLDVTDNEYSQGEMVIAFYGAPESGNLPHRLHISRLALTSPATVLGAPSAPAGMTDTGERSDVQTQPVSSMDTRSVYDTDFETLPDDLDWVEMDGSPIEVERLTKGGVSLVRVTSEEIVFGIFDPLISAEDFVIDLRVRLTDAILRIHTREQRDGCSRYEFTLDPRAFFASVEIVFPDCSSEYLEDGIARTRPSTWSDVRVEGQGDHLRLYLNGEMLFVGEDSTYADGRILFELAQYDPSSDTPAILEIDTLRIGVADSATTVISGRGGDRTDGRTSQSDSREPSLLAFDGTPEDVMAELAAQEVVPEGGYVLFREDYAWFEGAGLWFTPLASRQSREDVVMAGELMFEYGESDDFQSCALMARVQTDANGTTTAQINFGITSHGEVYIFDAEFAARLYNDYSERWALDSGDTLHVLLALQRGNATLFADGRLIFEDVKVERRSGSFGIGLVIETSAGRCEGRDIWVWTWQ